ncbi:MULTISPECIES: MFS transporter [unclassified Bradyrhizobium]|uniref:MFS transporter n=1 Tax=unclassified Bradyrhizobium TaxID=2631580 RepID=UPI0028E9AE18|nr:MULTISPECIES: MFS transporter [unclassified Bradyrhizobium]
MAEHLEIALADDPTIPDNGPSSRLPRFALLAVSVGGFLFQVDLTGLAAALPDIASSVGVPVQDQAWIIDIYSLALIFALPVAGPFADRHGRRRVFIGGGVLFALSSALSAASTTFESLLAWRVLQGVAGAAITSAAAALLAAAYPGKRRAWAFGIWGTVIGGSMVVGPPLGAIIASYAGWPWIFLINLPLCMALVVFALPLAESERIGSQPPMDWLGPNLLALVVGSSAYALLSSGGFRGIALATTVLASCAFWVAERRHPRPAFDFGLFASAPFLALCITAIASSIGYWSLLVHLPQMMRGPMGLDASRSGLVLTALTIPMLLLPSLGARLSQSMPARFYFGGGLTVVGVAALFLGAISTDLSSPVATWAVGAMLLLGGAGCALFNAQITAFSVSSVPADRAATAAAMCVTMRQVGFAFGIALIGAVLNSGGSDLYPPAFLLVGAITLVLGAIVFALLSTPVAKELQ